MDSLTRRFSFKSVDDVVGKMNQGDFVTVVDSVSHNILLAKLVRYGFKDIEWFESYLTGRTQCVRVRNAVSMFRYISRGVPQGSVLGPTVFNLFLNDITLLNLNSKILLYADDVVLYLTGDDVCSIIQKVQTDLNKIHELSCNNCLPINAAKTKALLVGRQHKLNNTQTLINLIIGCKPLEWVKSFSYLGLVMDETLSFNAAIEHMHTSSVFNSDAPD